MTYQDLQTVNQSLELTKIKSKRGNKKDFAVADEKIKAFRMLHPDGGINTKIISLKDGYCVTHAEITDSNGHILASGTAARQQTKDNSDSFIEACETAAVGRALRFLGIGVETISNSDVPVLSETQKQIELAQLRSKVMAYVIRHDFSQDKIKSICERYKVEQLMDMNADCCKHYIDYITKNGGDISE